MRAYLSNTFLRVLEELLVRAHFDDVEACPHILSQVLHLFSHLFTYLIFHNSLELLVQGIELVDIDRQCRAEVLLIPLRVCWLVYQLDVLLKHDRSDFMLLSLHIDQNILLDSSSLLKLLNLIGGCFALLRKHCLTFDDSLS